MALPPMGVEAVIRGLPGFLSGMKDMGDATTKTSGLLGKVGGIASASFKTLAIGATAAVGAIGAVGGAMIKLASDAAPLAGIKQAFEGLTASFEGGSDAMLKALQEASYGMTTNADLMRSFNLAAQLVSKDFAEQLPDAMVYLGKVSASTGESMQYLMDSLIRGVGRLQPMILDNLSVQIDLTTAYENWAKANGRTVDSMTKTEQQAAVMAETMAKLAENTASMPDIAGTAQQSFASLGVQLKNLKDEIGLALLPVVTPFLNKLGEIAKEAIPLIVEWIENRFVPAAKYAFEWIGKLIDIFGSFIKYIGLVVTDGDWLNDWLTHLPEPIQPIVKGFGQFIDMLISLGKYFGIVITDGDYLNNWLTHLPESIQPIVKNIGQFVSALKDEIPKAIDIVKVFISDAIQAIKTFWETNLQPIFDTIWNIIQDRIIPAVQRLFTAFQDSAPAAQEAIQEFISWFQTNIVPVFEGVVETIKSIMNSLGNIIGNELNDIAGFWEEHGETVIASISYILRIITTTIADTIALIATGIDVFLKILQGDWEGAWQSIKDFMVTLLESALSIVGVDLEEFVGVWTGIWENIKTIVSTIWQSIVDGVTGWVGDLRDKIVGGLTDIVDKVKNKLGIRSPSKVFMAIGEDLMRGMAQGVQNALRTPELALTRATTNLIRPVPQVSAPSGVTRSNVTNNQYHGDNLNLTINTSAPAEDIVADFRMMKALGNRV